MIEKKGKGNLVKDLRIINLIEADFNFNNKIMARMVMQYIEDNKLIPQEQYRSRKGHKAIEQVNNKRLLYDITHIYIGDESSFIATMHNHIMIILYIQL